MDITKKQAEDISLYFEVSADLVRIARDPVVGFTGRYTGDSCQNASSDTCVSYASGFSYASMGRAWQQPLNRSDDRCTIDWGYVYLASTDADTHFSFDAAKEKLYLQHYFTSESRHTDFIIAYDDLLSINYFGQWRKAYWTHTYQNILAAISASFSWLKCWVIQRKQKNITNWPKKWLLTGKYGLWPAIITR